MDSHEYVPRTDESPVLTSGPEDVSTDSASSSLSHEAVKEQEQTFPTFRFPINHATRHRRTANSELSVLLINDRRISVEFCLEQYKTEAGKTRFDAEIVLLYSGIEGKRHEVQYPVFRMMRTDIRDQGEMEGSMTISLPYVLHMRAGLDPGDGSNGNDSDKSKQKMYEETTVRPGTFRVQWKALYQGHREGDRKGVLDYVVQKTIEFHVWIAESTNEVWKTIPVPTDERWWFVDGEGVALHSYTNEFERKSTDF